jgi:hypothetical protein
MGFSEILNKLATKKMIEGDTAFAYNLVSFADKSEENPEDDTIKAEMYKKGKDKKTQASPFELLIQKYAGTKVAAFDPDQPEVPDGLYNEAYGAFIAHLMDFYEESEEEAEERAERPDMQVKKDNFISNYIDDESASRWEESFGERYEESSTRKNTRVAARIWDDLRLKAHAAYEEMFDNDEMAKVMGLEFARNTARSFIDEAIDSLLLKSKKPIITADELLDDLSPLKAEMERISKQRNDDYQQNLIKNPITKFSPDQFKSWYRKTYKKAFRFLSLPSDDRFFSFYPKKSWINELMIDLENNTGLMDAKLKSGNRKYKLTLMPEAPEFGAFVSELKELEYSPELSGVGRFYTKYKNKAFSEEIIPDTQDTTIAFNTLRRKVVSAKKELTIQQVKNELSQLGVALKKNENEYRVNFKGGKEETAYYTDDLNDALETGKEMSKEIKKTSSTLKSLIHKYAGKEGKGSFKNKIKEMDGFLRMDGKAFCFENNAQAKKALAVAETAANFLNWQVMKGDGCFKLMEAGMDKKSNTLKKMIKKYAMEFDDFDVPESGATIEEMYDEEDNSYVDNNEIIVDGFQAGLENDFENPHDKLSYEHTLWQLGNDAGKEISDHFNMISEK